MNHKTTTSLLLAIGTSCGTPDLESRLEGCLENVSKQAEKRVNDLRELTCQDLLKKLDDIRNPPEEYVVLQDKNTVLLSHCSNINQGLHFVEQLQTCYENVSSFLGTLPITRCIMHTQSFSDDLYDIETRYVGETGAAGCFLIRGSVGKVPKKAECQTEINPAEEQTICYYGHEVTHLFVAGTVLQKYLPWLNEGLADYVSFYLAGKIFECDEEGYLFRDVVDTEKQVIKRGKYVDLTKTRSEHRALETEAAAYTTGACVWETIVTNFGYGSFRQIIKKVEESRFVSMSFVDDILLPVITQKGIDILKERFGNDSIEAYR